MSLRCVPLPPDEPTPSESNQTVGIPSPWPSGGDVLVLGVGHLYRSDDDAGLQAAVA